MGWLHNSQGIISFTDELAARKSMSTSQNGNTLFPLSINLIVTTNIKQDDLLLSNHNRERDTITVC